MPDRYQESHIRRVPLFENMPPEPFHKVARAFHVRRYDTGEIIFEQGSQAQGLYIFIEGQAVLLQYTQDGNRRQIGILREGQYINQNALFNDQRETATLHAVRPVTLLLLTRQAMADVLAYNTDVAEAMGIKRSQQHHMHDVHFKTQRENEKVILLTRRHWWAYIRWMGVPVIVMIALWIAAYALPLTALWLVLSFILPTIAAVYLYVEWRNDSVIITNQRVIRIIHTILTFSEIRNEVTIDSVQEANAEIPPLDPFALLFNYGEVEIKTAGSQGNFILDFMPNPEKVQDIILEDAWNQRFDRQSRGRQTLRADIAKWTGAQAGASSANRPAPARKVGEHTWEPDSGPLSPFRLRFPTPEGGTVYRTHWFVWAQRMFFPLVWLLATVILGISWVVVPFLRDLGFIGAVITFVMFLFGAVWAYITDWDWRNDYYIVGDTYVTFVNQRPLWLQNENDQILLRQIDNVKSEIQGIFQRLFDYGDVSMSLVGADEHKVFKTVHRPTQIQEDISQRQGRLKRKMEDVNESQQREIIGEYITEYHRMLQEQGYPTPPTDAPSSPVQPWDNPPTDAPSTLRDGNRPPKVPRPRPRMSSGRPYEQDPQARQHPQPHDPDQRPYHPPNLPRTGNRPPKFPRQHPPSDRNKH